MDFVGRFHVLSLLRRGSRRVPTRFREGPWKSTLEELKSAGGFFAPKSRNAAFWRQVARGRCSNAPTRRRYARRGASSSWPRRRACHGRSWPASTRRPDRAPTHRTRIRRALRLPSTSARGCTIGSTSCRTRPSTLRAACFFRGAGLYLAQGRQARHGPLGALASRWRATGRGPGGAPGGPDNLPLKANDADALARATSPR